MLSSFLTNLLTYQLAHTGNLFCLLNFSLNGERISQQAIAQLIGDPRYLRFERPYPRRR